MKRVGICILVMVVAMALTSFVFAAEKKAAPKQAAGDDKFIMDAAAGGMYEVEAGKLAAQKASNEDAKKFGQRMADDHAKANDELMQLATTKGVTVPKEMDKKHRDMVDKFSKMSGAAFDKAYMSEMVKDHTKDVSDFRKEVKDGKDPDVKGWAGKILPTLEDHLKMARDVSNQLGKKGGAGEAGKKSSQLRNLSGPISAIFESTRKGI